MSKEFQRQEIRIKLLGMKEMAIKLRFNQNVAQVPVSTLPHKRKKKPILCRLGIHTSLRKEMSSETIERCDKCGKLVEPWLW